MLFELFDDASSFLALLALDVLFHLLLLEPLIIHKLRDLVQPLLLAFFDLVSPVLLILLPLLIGPHQRNPLLSSHVFLRLLRLLHLLLLALLEDLNVRLQLHRCSI